MKDDGLWSAGLRRRVAERTAPPCVGCSDAKDETPPERELTLLWRRSKSFRRHRAF